MDEQYFFECLQSYLRVSEMLAAHTYEEIRDWAAGASNMKPAVLDNYKIKEFLNVSLTAGYCDVMAELINHRLNYDWIYERLEDNISKRLFFELICFRIMPDRTFLDNDRYYIEQNPIADANVKKAGRFPDTVNKTSASVIIEKKNLIKNNRPEFSICINPILDDLWEIPYLIDCVHDGYTFYLRREKRKSRTVIVLYALPKLKKRKCYASKGKRIVALAPYETPWRNVELVKDCGLIPYLLHKNYGYDVTMVGAKPAEPYAYAELVDGLKFEFLPDGSIVSKTAYLEKNAKQIDVLILRSCYDMNLLIAPLYKRLNPNGYIYDGLDANSSWMDRILWNNDIFIKFMNSCDVLATSGSATQQYLNEKWPWKIEHIPNGYYDFDHRTDAPAFQKKENVILTVARLGSQQKATNILLEAFAIIANDIPNWKLRMVGGIEAGFRQYVDEYYNKYPYLKDRIEWVGSIQDRTQLFLEYRRAKIFALSSNLEGGTPNVVAEALYGGCVVATTRIDACEEATDSQKCGRISEVNDVQGFSKILLELAKSPELEKMSVSAYQYAKSHFDMNQIVAKLHELIFGE